MDKPKQRKRDSARNEEGDITMRIGSEHMRRVTAELSVFGTLSPDKRLLVGSV
jgi:hypothetical protein